MDNHNGAMASTLKRTPDETLKKRGRPRSEEAALAVLDAAYRLSATEGLKGATMQAIAKASGVSKMTIYKWWDNRLELLIDAFLRQMSAVLPLSDVDPPYEAITAHAARYLETLRGDLGRVQFAVLAECMAETGSSEVFVERYLSIRRNIAIGVIKRGQRDGSIASRRPPDALYDQIYGTIFYRFQFGLKGLTQSFVKSHIDATFLLAPAEL